VHKTQYFLTYFIRIWSPIESLAEIGPSYGAKGHAVVGIHHGAMRFGVVFWQALKLRDKEWLTSHDGPRHMNWANVNKHGAVGFGFMHASHQKR